MNKRTETKYRNGPMEIQYDESSKYRVRKRTFKSLIPSQKKSRLFCITRFKKEYTDIHGG